MTDCAYLMIRDVAGVRTRERSEVAHDYEIFERDIIIELDNGDTLTIGLNSDDPGKLLITGE